MALVTVERWQQTADVEVFYDLSTRKLLYKKYNWVYTQCVDSGVRNRYQDLQVLETRCLGAAISPDERHLAYNRTHEELEILEVVSGEHCAVKLAIGKSIFGYHWGRMDCLADFALVHSTGMDFYKLQEHPLRLLPIKSYAYTISQYWFEPISGIFVLAHSPTKPGSMHLFSFYQQNTPKFDGAKFKLLQQVPATYHWTPRLHNSLNLTMSLSNLDSNQLCTLARIYGNVYFLHMSFQSGQLNLYRLLGDKVENVEFLIVKPPGVYDLFVLDSVIVLQSGERREEYYYDIKAPSFKTDPFASVRYIGKSGLSKASSVQVKGLTPLILEKAEEWPVGLLRIDQDIWVDMNEGCCYRKDIQPLDLLFSQDNLTERMLFILRRSGYKLGALNYLRDQIMQQVRLESLSSLFATISKVYREAALERQSPTRVSSRLSKADLRNALSEQEIKVESGITVILQIDMHAVVLLDVYENQRLGSEDSQRKLDPGYVTAVLLEYQHSLVHEDIIVNPNVQLLIAQQLEKTGNYCLLQSMLQYRVLSDSHEISHLLIRVANPAAYARYPPALQLAVDMLLRLGEYREIANLLLERNMVYEVIVLLELKQLSAEVLQHIERQLEGVAVTEEVCVVKDWLERKKSLVVNGAD